MEEENGLQSQCVSFVADLMKHEEEQGTALKPFFLGVSGIQGAGKTTLVSNLQQILNSSPHNIKTLAFSIDDLYLPHEGQQQIARYHHDNSLIQNRGLPGTHDLGLLTSIFNALLDDQYTRIPKYDKSAYGGQGDRMDGSLWTEANAEGDRPVELVIVEGWCLGFQYLKERELEKKWCEAVIEKNGVRNAGKLGIHRLADVKFINEKVREYQVITNHLDALIQLDAEDINSVYEWRQEQEAMLRVSTGSGMTDEQVTRFVDKYMPAYELYLPGLRAGVVKGKRRQLRFVLDRKRKVKKTVRI